MLNLGICNIKVIATIFLKCMHQFTVSLERIKGFFSLLFLHYFIISGSLTVDYLGDLKWYRLWLKFAFSQLIFMLRTFPYVYLMSMSSLLRSMHSCGFPHFYTAFVFLQMNIASFPKLIALRGCPFRI